MTNIDSLTPTQDERIIAALSHASALLPLMGVIAPIVIWITQKEKSRYVAFQSLQALVYQLVMIVGYLVGMGCYMIFLFSTMIALPFLSTSGSSDIIDPIFEIGLVIPFLVIGAFFLVGFLFMVYGVIGAVKAFQGKPFRYFLIGKRVEKYIQPKQEADITAK
jgi:uncharacterized protein